MSAAVPKASISRDLCSNEYFAILKRRTYCWHYQSALSTTRRNGISIIFNFRFKDFGLAISRWSRALSRSSSFRFASTATDMSSFMSSESGLPRIISIIAGSIFLGSNGGRSDGALSRGVEFSIDHLRSDCIVYRGVGN